MTNGIWSVIQGICHGFRDAVLGVFALYQLSKDESERRSKPSLSRSSTGGSGKPPTVLELRRQAKMMHEAAAKCGEGGAERKEESKHGKPKLLYRILQCCCLNGVLILCSIAMFNYLLLPFLSITLQLIFLNDDYRGRVWLWLSHSLTVVFSAVWIVPCSLVCKIISGLWFQDIADAAYRKSRGRPVALSSSVGKILADSLFSIIVQLLFLVQGMLMNLLPIPVLGKLVEMLHMSLLYSLYSFDYKWINMGWEVKKRVSYIELHWPYFLGFGLPLCIITSLPPSFIISGCIFSVIFPFYIISGNEAEPIDMLYCDYPLRLFTPVITIGNTIFYRSFQTTTTAAAPPAPTPHQRQQARS